MSNDLANNSKLEVDSLLGAPQFLKAKFGTNIPLEGQVPLTHQALALVNGTVTDVVDGSNTLDISADLAAGNAIVAFTLQGARNMIGRTVTINCSPTNAGGARTVAIQLPVGFVYAYQGAAIPYATVSMSFPVTVGSTIGLVFLPSQRVQVIGDVTGYAFV